MPRRIQSHRASERRPRSFHPTGRPRRTIVPRCKLDSANRLIAPPHSFQIPNLAGVRTRFQFSTGTEPLMPLARSLIKSGFLREKHLQKATSPVEAMQLALSEIVSRAFGEEPDQFSVELGISDSLDDYRKSRFQSSRRGPHPQGPLFIAPNSFLM
jgi:hypothetical protein